MYVTQETIPSGISNPADTIGGNPQSTKRNMKMNEEKVIATVVQIEGEYFGTDTRSKFDDNTPLDRLLDGAGSIIRDVIGEPWYVDDDYEKFRERVDAMNYLDKLLDDWKERLEWQKREVDRQPFYNVLRGKDFEPLGKLRMARWRLRSSRDIAKDLRKAGYLSDATKGKIKIVRDDDGSIYVTNKSNGSIILRLYEVKEPAELLEAKRKKSASVQLAEAA